MDNIAFFMTLLCFAGFFSALVASRKPRRMAGSTGAVLWFINAVVLAAGSAAHHQPMVLIPTAISAATGLIYLIGALRAKG